MYMIWEHTTHFSITYMLLWICTVLRIKIWNFFHFFLLERHKMIFFQKRAQLLFKLKKEYFLVLTWAMLLKKFCAGSCFIYMMLINFLVLIFFSFLSFLRFFNGPKSKEYISTSFFSFFALLFFKGLLRIFDGILYHF